MYLVPFFKFLVQRFTDTSCFGQWFRELNSTPVFTTPRNHQKSSLRNHFPQTPYWTPEVWIQFYGLARIYVDSGTRCPVLFIASECQPSTVSFKHFRADQTALRYCWVPVRKCSAKLNLVMKETEITVIKNYPALFCLNLIRCKNR